MPLDVFVGHPAKKTPAFECRAAPAPGFRAYQYGTLYSIGDYGYSWSSLVSEGNAYHLGFGADWLLPQGNLNRAYGFQLRCLQEEREPPGPGLPRQRMARYRCLRKTA
jgi:hypothetical protein